MSGQYRTDRINARLLRAATILASVFLFLPGCATVTPAARYFANYDKRANVFLGKGKEEIHKIAILPFKAPTELIGTSISDMFVTEIMRTGYYEVIERGQITAILKESELALSGLSTEQAVEMGAILGADGIVIGTVDEYGTVAIKGHPYPSLGVSARLISCKTGGIAWSVDMAKLAESKRATLSGHTRSLIHDMVASLFTEWHK